MVPSTVIPIPVGIKIKLSPKIVITADAINRMNFVVILNKITDL